MKQPVDAIQHVLVLYKLAPVGLRDASLHTSDEAGLIVEHAGNSVFHQLLGVLAIGRGHLLKPRFDVGVEMYFHALQVTRNPELRQHGMKAPEIRVSGSTRRGSPGSSLQCLPGKKEACQIKRPVSHLFCVRGLHAI